VSFKTILALVEPNPDRADSLHAALSAAQAFDGVLIGVGAAALDGFLEPAFRARGPRSAGALREVIEDNLRLAENIFRGVVVEQGGASTLWRSLAAYPTEAVIKLSAGADLIVMARPDHDSRGACAEVGAVIMGAGGPVLLTPPGGAGPIGETVVVGWKNTREARRALSDALPFLKRARRVLIANFDEPGAASATTEELEDVLSRLGRHGVAASIETMQAERTHPGDLLIRMAVQQGADLIVAGGYGHSRLQDWVFGGVTEILVTRSPVFVLLSR
jgi:nucleotide-binding universal stress UspA family protein